MRIAITGASGFVGKLIYPKLIQAGCDVVVIGRNKHKLNAEFPNSNCFEYSELPQAFKDIRLVLHLAALNSVSKLPAKEFERINVDLMMRVAKAAKSANIDRFVNISSFHALDSKNISHYANSKRDGVKTLNSLNWPAVENVYLPAVYDDSWAGKLSVLNVFPNRFSRILFSPISALKPCLDIKYLSEHILSPIVPQKDDIEILLYDDKAKNNLYKFIKRTIDLSFVFFVAVFLSWLMLLAWVGVRLTSTGPGIFVQERVGLNQKIFKCYKFRTMKVGTNNAGTHDVSVSSLTSIGGFLRKTKIDELPQIVNILQNELSLVGPRPCLPNQLELIKEREARGVFSVKPGVTGLSQINNIDMSIPKTLSKWDARYIALRGLLFYMKIIIATARGNGHGDKIGLTAKSVPENDTF